MEATYDVLDLMSVKLDPGMIQVFNRSAETASNGQCLLLVDFGHDCQYDSI
jgi:hypothetical protein